jgi:hypothetical protein
VIKADVDLVRCWVRRPFCEVDCSTEDRHQDDDEVAEIQRAGRDDGGFQPGPSSSSPPTARQEHLCGALRRPEVSSLTSPGFLQN